MRQTHRYAVRGLGALAVGALGVTLAMPATVGLAAEPPSPGPEWGVMQERPPLSQSQDPGAGPTVESPKLASGANGSTLAAAATTPAWVLHGAGWGHGLGMSQFGAFEMARAGYTAPQILSHYYTGTTYDRVTDNQVLDVNVLYHVDAKSTVTASTTEVQSGTGGGAFEVTMVGATGTMEGSPSAPVTFSMNAGKIVATCGSCTGAKSLTGSQATLTWDTLAQDKTLLKIGGTQYRDGTIRIKPYGTTSFNVVNRVRLHDEYLDYIAESPWSWNVEALKAQAAAARGYALAKYTNLGGKDQSSCDCHLLDTTSDQVYGGYTTVLSYGNAPYWQNWKNAVRATGTTSTGYVARYGGKIIQAFFSSSSGGRTENNEDVWYNLSTDTATPIGYLRGVSDAWSLKSSNPARAWRQVTSGSSMASVFGLPDVARLDLSARTPNGGIKKATATSSGGVVRTITGDEFRSIAASGTSYSSRVNSTMIRHLTGRLSGSDRYASAVAVAQRVPVTASSVVVAGGDMTLSDASVAGPLATTVGAPLLLTQQSKLPSATVTELNRRGTAVKTAYIVGGTGVVSSGVESQLRSRGISVVRLGGRDRYQTSAMVAQTIKGKRGSVSAVVVAGGLGLADALAASGPAAALKEPILLTPASGMSPYTRQGLTATGAKTARVVGGTAVVGDQVVADLKAAGVTTVNRLAGANRFATSGAVAGFYRAKMPNTSEVVLTSGADSALVDSLVAGTTQRLIALTSKWKLEDPAAVTLQMTPQLETVTAVGGTGVLSSSALNAAARS